MIHLSGLSGGAGVDVKRGCLTIGCMTGKIHGYDPQGRQLFDHRWDWAEWKASRTQADTNKPESQGVKLLVRQD